MMRHPTIPFGTSLWLYGILSTFFIIGAILWLTKFCNTMQKKYIRIAIAIVYSISFFAFHIYTYYNGLWDRHNSLPLHLCSISMVCGIISMFTLNVITFEWSCYFGIAGGLNAIISPEFINGFDRFYLVQFYVDHGGVLLMPLFLGIYEGLKPRTMSWMKIFYSLNLLSIFLFVFNWLNESNYMYVNAKPASESPLLIGHWPWYILGLEIVALAHFYIIYVLFHGLKQWK